MDLKDPRNVGYKQLRNAKFFLEMIGLECPYDRNGVGIVYALQHDLTITDTVIQHMIIIMKKYHSFVSLCLPFVVCVSYIRPSTKRNIRRPTSRKKEDPL